MHYIVGRTKISFRKTAPRPGATSATRVSTKPPEFEYNTVYTLYNIAKKPSGEWIYTFKSNRGASVVKTFDSHEQADGWLSGLLGEQLPDYKEFYRQSTA
jgi:hypothetical protein